MALTKEFKESVADNNITRVRIMLKDIMLIDPSLKSFNEMLEYAEKNMSDLYDEHDGETFVQNPNEWTEEYMNQQMVSVVMNFSKERVAILKNIVQYRYDNKPKEENHLESKNRPTGVQIAGGIIAAAGAGTIAGGIIGANVPVAIVGGVAVAGGVAMILLGRNKEE